MTLYKYSLQNKWVAVKRVVKEQNKVLMCTQETAYDFWAKFMEELLQYQLFQEYAVGTWYQQYKRSNKGRMCVIPPPPMYNQIVSCPLYQDTPWHQIVKY